MKALRLVRVIVDSLKDITDMESLITRYREIDSSYVVPIAKRLGIPQLVVLNYELTLSVAFYLRGREVLESQALSRTAELVKKAKENGDEWILASESVALTALGFEKVRDVEPGEAVFISSGGHFFNHQSSVSAIHSPCIFEYVYFARPDSTIDGVSVHEARRNMGVTLAERILEEIPAHDIDVVIPVPDSGRISALALAERLGVSYREGFVKNRYVGRTFLMPGQAIRQDSVRKKLNPMPKEFEGRNVLLVDDSIVRGNTSKKIVEMARIAGANKVFFASAAPPVCHANVYGIDMPAASELIATSKSREEIAAWIGCDQVFYQRLDDLVAACMLGDNPPPRFDASCFDGDYVVGKITDSYLAELEALRHDDVKQKGAALAEGQSGNGR